MSFYPEIIAIQTFFKSDKDGLK